MSQRIPHLYVAASDLHDRGIFSLAPIPQGSIIEICPVLIIPPDQLEHLKKTVLYDYYWDWNEDKKSGAIALGFGALYNHSYQPNARYLVDFENRHIEIHAIANIEAGEEINFNYNGDPKDQSKVWFDK